MIIMNITHTWHDNCSLIYLFKIGDVFNQILSIFEKSIEYRNRGFYGIKFDHVLLIYVLF